MENQEKVWDNIAQEWHEFKQSKPLHTIEYLKDKTGKVLDLGSGSGRNLTQIPNGKMYLVDFSSEMIRLAKQKAKAENIEAEFEVADLSKLPYGNNFFDSAIAVSSLHCIEGEENRKKAISELFRVLKPNATAEITVWNKDSKPFAKAGKEKMVAWREKGKRYYYLFEQNEIHQMFENAGFKILEKFEPFRNIIFIVQKP